MAKLGTLSRRVLDGIGPRIALVLAIALLPLTIVSVVRSQTIVSQSQDRSEAALQGETLRAVSTVLGNIEVARGAAFGLANAMPELLGDIGSCNAAMARLVEGSEFSFAGFYTLDSVVTCSNAGRDVVVTLNEEATARLADPMPYVQVSQSGPISRTSIIYAAHPVTDGAGDVVGFAAVSLPHSALGLQDGLSPLPLRNDLVPNVAFMTFTPGGDILTASGVEIANADRMLPEGMTRDELLATSVPFTAVSAEGDYRTYSVIPVLGGEIFALGSWPERDVIEDTMFFRFPALFPILMWMASLVVAYLAAEYFMTRHVRHLRRSIRAFSDTRRSLQPGAFENAPLELRDMGAAFVDMVDTILREEAELEDNVRQKDVLLREVHHRVKNNLQLIASIMNMQMRKSRSEEARSLMRGLHDRVMSLATVHKGLYMTSGLADVRADELLGDILKQVTHLGTINDGDIEVEQHFDPLQLSPEQAVPLTLLVTEALTNALKYVSHPPGQKSNLRIRLEANDDRQVRVVVANTVAPEGQRPAEGPTGLGTQLLSAFSMQLHGTLDKRIVDDWFVITVDFEADPLDPNGAREPNF